MRSSASWPLETRTCDLIKIPLACSMAFATACLFAASITSLGVSTWPRVASPSASTQTGASPGAGTGPAAGHAPGIAHKQTSTTAKKRMHLFMPSTRSPRKDEAPLDALDGRHQAGRLVNVLPFRLVLYQGPDIFVDIAHALPAFPDGP